MTLTPGKLRGLKAVSSPQGITRSSGHGSEGLVTTSARGTPGKPDLEGFKAAVTEALTPHASAVLLDPEWGLTPAKHRAKGAGPLAGL